MGWQRWNSQSHKWIQQTGTKTIHNWAEKVIHWELCERLKFDNAEKWFMHKAGSVLENEMNKILWDFEIPDSDQKTRLCVNQQEEKILSSNRFCWYSGP